MQRSRDSPSQLIALNREVEQLIALNQRNRQDLDSFATSLLLPVANSAPHVAFAAASVPTSPTDAGRARSVTAEYVPQQAPPPPPPPPPPQVQHLVSLNAHKLTNSTNSTNDTAGNVQPTLLSDTNLSQFELFAMDRLQRNGKLSNSDCLETALSLHDLRSVFRKQNTGTTVQFILIGFAPISERNLFLRALRYATRSKVIFASYVEPSSVHTSRLQRFEVFIRANCSKPELAQDTDNILPYLRHWKFSLCCIDLNNCTAGDQALLTAIERIESGRMPYGNWKCQRNANFRDTIRIHLELRDRQRAHQHVLQETGLEFLPSSMLRLFYDAQNARIDFSSLQYNVGNLRARIQAIISANADNTHTAATTQTRENIVVALSEALRDSAWSSVPQFVSMRTVIVDLTSEDNEESSNTADTSNITNSTNPTNSTASTNSTNTPNTNSDTWSGL